MSPASLNLTGSWRNNSRDNEVCGIMEHAGGMFTLIDEQGKRGYGHINGDKLTFTYDDFAGPTKMGKTHNATILDNGMRLHWGGDSFWTKKTDHAQIWLLNLDCLDRADNRTKGLRDEIYVVRTIETEILPELPRDERGHWSVNKKNPVRDQLLWDGPLAEGQTLSLVFSVMENDDEKATFMRELGLALQKIAQQMRDDEQDGMNEEDGGKDSPLRPILEGVGVVLQAFASLGNDDDDHLGTFSCTLRRVNGRVETELQCSEKGHSQLMDSVSNEDPCAGHIRLTGSSAKYDLWVYAAKN